MKLQFVSATILTLISTTAYGSDTPMIKTNETSHNVTGYTSQAQENNEKIKTITSSKESEKITPYESTGIILPDQDLVNYAPLIYSGIFASSGIIIGIYSPELLWIFPLAIGCRLLCVDFFGYRYFERNGILQDLGIITYSFEKTDRNISS